MQLLFFRFGSWVGQKLLAAALIVLLALAAYGVWLFLQDEAEVEVRRIAELRRAMVEREQLLAARASVEKRLAEVRGEIARQQERARQAGRVIEILQELENWWDRWFGNTRQQAANAEQTRRLASLRTEATGKLAELQRVATQVQWEGDGIESALQRVEREVGRLEVGRSKLRRYLHDAWDDLKWYVVFALGSYFLGPTAWALLMYFGFARLIVRGRPIRLGADPPALPRVGESRVSVEVVLGSGEALRIKEKFLQSSDEDIRRRTRFVLDWGIPFTSAACGLVELVELCHEHANREARVTLSNGDDPHVELALVDVPAGASLVLRPSFLAGVIQRRDERLEIRRHWRLLHWQAWVTGQFRFFEFRGPCRMIVSGSRGVRAEVLAAPEGQPNPARRTNQDATIGFTPNLLYRPVRAETFWSYYRGMNPLFDDLFAGRGVFVLQETAGRGPAARAGRFWSAVGNGVLKVFGW